jgi:hypothetical protein
MDLKGHMDALSLTRRALAREARLSEATIHYIIAGKPVSKFVANLVVAVLSQKYGRKVEIEEVEGLVLESNQAENMP